MARRTQTRVIRKLVAEAGGYDSHPIAERRPHPLGDQRTHWLEAEALARLHRDQRGAIAPLSVFAIFMFTILMVQVVNVGRQLDDKLRMPEYAAPPPFASLFGLPLRGRLPQRQPRRIAG